MSLEVFHPLVRDWFSSRFAGPTGVQERGWRAIAAGRHALLTAPTGSGKTLAAFLHCLDRLVRAGLEGRIDEVPGTVYVSPLKALSNDIHLNLQQPLADLTALAVERGLELETIRVAVRTGDTPAAERRAAVRRPPHLWITTPESLYILMTSDSGRRALRGTGTVIVDEIHALADDKRGAHLSLTLERLADLAERPLQRVGLSATVHPIEEVARFLLGAGDRPADASDDTAAPDCVIVDEGRKRPLDLGIELPRCEIGPIATQAIWDDTLDRIAALSGEHRTTLVFTNTRRLVERVAHQLAARLGDEAVAPHHGSLSRAIRLRSEERLKSGAARVCVATASLELGIDVGTVDLVCQIGSPRSVAVALQRIGRSGHALGRTPKGRLFPLTRDELVECAALLRLARRGEIDRLEVPPWPLDVLAQQIAAECAACADPLDEEALFRAVRRAWPYRGLPRARFDEVIAMLSEGVATARGRRGALLHRDGVHRKLRARRGTRLLALTSGGAIPDNADYDVVKDPEGVFVGRVNEDFAIESMAGDVFLLGNAAWQIRRVERGRVRVEAAPGATPTVPFWLGEAPGRTRELSAAVGALREEVDARGPQAQGHLEAETGIGPEAAKAIVDFVAEGKRVLGVVPTARRIVAERFFDETGGMQLVIHAPLGSRINRAWGLALRKRFCRTFDFELQAAATDDGINLSLGPQHSFPLGEIFGFVRARGVEEVLTQAVLPSPIFTARWRWTATRSLQVARWEGGRKVPPPLLRMRCDDLLGAVFPAQTQCQDNNPGGDIEVPDHPLVFETLRDCLEEALDVEGLRDTLRDVESGRIEILARDTPQPSVFAHGVLNAMPYAFLDDAPLEERRARAVNLRRALPEDAADLGRLDPQAIRAAAEDAWPRPRDAEELHEALLGLTVLPLDLFEARFPAAASSWLDDLEADGRAARLRGHASGTCLAAAEREDQARAALTGDADALLRVVRGWAEVLGPFTAASLGRDLGFEEGRIAIACAALEGEGTILRGAFTGAAAAGEEWCDRRILARIHRATLQTLRREIEPVPAAIFLRFLTTWQHAAFGSAGRGADGLLQAIELLQGFEAPLAAWEASLLPARVERYDPEDLDRLLLGGQIVWGRFAPRPEGGGGVTRASLISMALREDLPWLLDRDAPPPTLSSRAAALRDWLAGRGPSYPGDAARSLSLLPSELDDAMGELIAAGLATLDGFSALRRLTSAAGRRDAPGRRAGKFVRRRGAGAASSDGRLWLFDRGGGAPEDRMTQIAAQLLRRWGVLFRDLLAREGTAPAWRDLLPELRRAEARGEVRGGRFVDGFPGEQFALAEAVEALRAARRAGPTDAVREISAADPLNLAGIVTPGPRIPAFARGRVLLHDGVPAATADAR
ncbi:MAG TPA: DEAD/DEAH box helicase [Candidatus Polarisedimenticolia bacterium]|nr:DEAD/DEAH box helicase [Candidatus Polarisedimenticolia bacterium]